MFFNEFILDINVNIHESYFEALLASAGNIWDSAQLALSETLPSPKVLGERGHMQQWATSGRHKLVSWAVGAGRCTVLIRAFPVGQLAEFPPHLQAVLGAEDEAGD